MSRGWRTDTVRIPIIDGHARIVSRPEVTVEVTPRDRLAAVWARLRRSEFAADVRRGTGRALEVMGGFVVAYLLLVIVRGGFVLAEMAGLTR